MIDNLAQRAKPIPRGLFLQATIVAVIAGAALLSACGQSSDSQPPTAQQQAADEQARKEADEKAWADAEKTCPSRKSYPCVAMMQSGQDWCGDDGPTSLDGPS